MRKCFCWSIALIWLVGETVPDQRLRTLANFNAIGEINLVSFKYCPLVVNGILAFVMSKWLSAKEHFIEDHSCRPYVHFLADLWIFLTESFRWQVPICPNTLITEGNS